MQLDRVNVVRRSRTILTLCLTACLVAGCSSAPHSQHPTRTTDATATATTNADAATADDTQLPNGVPTPPRPSDFDMKTAAGKAKYLAALKAWRDKLTPEQKAAVADSLGITTDPEQQAEAEWFNALDPGVQKACVQLPIVAIPLAALSLPATSQTSPDTIVTYAKTIADIRDLHVDTDLRKILGSMSTELRRHARDVPPINDPVLVSDISAMQGWIETHCTMPE